MAAAFSRIPDEEAALDQLRQRRHIWRKKAAIRACYANWVRILKPWAAAGGTLEVGSGTGVMKELWGDSLSTSDILAAPWIDFRLDAENMDLAEESFQNMLCVDVLHHLPDPHRFIDQAAGVVADRGRFLLLEPWISPVSNVFYRLMHHEHVWMHDYVHPEMAEHDPWAGNLALANIVFGREMAGWSARHPEWRLLHKQRLSFLDFQVAGGFRPWTLTHREKLYQLCLTVDRCLEPLMPLLAFRVCLVFERMPRSASEAPPTHDSVALGGL